MIKWENKSDAFTESLAPAEAYISNCGLPSYNSVLLALEQIKALASEHGGVSDRCIKIAQIASTALGEQA